MAPAGRRWLLVGALEAETSPIVARLQGATPAAPAGWDHVATWGSAKGEIRQPVEFLSGDLDGVPVSVLTVGVGPANAERYTRHALEAMHPEVPVGVVSFGTCGSLVDSLRAGDVVTATALLVEGASGTEQRLQMQPVGRKLRQVAMATCRVPVRCPPAHRAVAAPATPQGGDPPLAVCVCVCVCVCVRARSQVFDPERRSALASVGCEVCEMEGDGVLRAGAIRGKQR